MDNDFIVHGAAENDGHKIVRHEIAGQKRYSDYSDYIICAVFKECKNTSENSKLSCILLQNNRKCLTGNK